MKRSSYETGRKLYQEVKLAEGSPGRPALTATIWQGLQAVSSGGAPSVPAVANLIESLRCESQLVIEAFNSRSAFSRSSSRFDD